MEHISSVQHAPVYAPYLAFPTHPPGFGSEELPPTDQVFRIALTPFAKSSCEHYRRRTRAYTTDLLIVCSFFRQQLAFSQPNSYHRSALCYVLKTRLRFVFSFSACPARICGAFCAITIMGFRRHFCAHSSFENSLTVLFKKK